MNEDEWNRLMAFQPPGEMTNVDGEKLMFIMCKPELVNLKMPMSMSFDRPDPAPDFLLGQQLGGVVMRDPVDRIITVTTPVGAHPFARVTENNGVDEMLADGWSLQHAWRGPVVVGCETPMIVGAHPFTRTRVTEEHGSLGSWRRDDDHGSACEVKDLRVERFERADSTASGRPEYRAWLAPVGPVVREARWVRADGGSILARRVASGRYADRLPTNRKRKRERAKERRRAATELPA